MKDAFRPLGRISTANTQKLCHVNTIVSEYMEDGLRVTLRQLYYQLVTRGYILNEVAEYAKLSKLVVQGRMWGLIDWDAREDRLREPYLPYTANSITGGMLDLMEAYRLDRQAGQDVYIELWVEKDALSSVLRRVTSEYHVRLVVNRGYASCTAMRKSTTP